MNVKIKWLRDKIHSLDMQAMIISNPINIKYLTGIDAEGILLLTRKENIYITDGRYIEAVNSALTIDDGIIVYDYRDVDSFDNENFFMFCENVGFEEEYVTYSKYKEYMHKYKINNLVETEKIIEKQRMIKDKEEIECIKKACEITDKCFNHLLSFIKKGMTEKEVAFEIERFFKTNGAEGLAFEPIVASGINSSMPHAVPADKKIESGDCITIDFGCRYNGYCSDMTRTIFVGEVPQYIKPVYELVLKNQEQVLNDINDYHGLTIVHILCSDLLDLIKHDIESNPLDENTIEYINFIINDNNTTSDPKQSIKNYSELLKYFEPYTPANVKGVIRLINNIIYFLQK